MQRLIIKGQNKLSGSIKISGSKNASLPILAATILSSQVKLTNIPLVKDIFTMVELLRFIENNIKVTAVPIKEVGLAVDYKSDIKQIENYTKKRNRLI